MFDVLFTSASRVTDYRGTLEVDKDRSQRFNRLLRERGIFKSEGKLYVSLAHDERDIRQTIDAFDHAAKEVAGSKAL
jgi:glutamate-1-semialdehyde 2,1-aminomutase